LEKELSIDLNSEKDKAVSTFNNTADSLQQQYSETLKGKLNLKIDEIVPERPSNNAFAWPKMEFFTHIPLYLYVTAALFIVIVIYFIIKK
jgi:hypothetical protein